MTLHTNKQRAAAKERSAGKGAVLRAFFILLLVLGLSGGAFSQPVVLDDNTSDINLGRDREIFEDREGLKTLDDICSKGTGPWVVNTAENINFGYTDSVCWVRAGLVNRSSKPLRFLVEIGYPLLDYVHTFVVRENSRESWIMGDKKPYRERPVDHPCFITPVQLAPGEQLMFYARIKTTSSMQIPLHLYSPGHYLDSKQFFMMLQGLYYGSMVIMALYNFFLFLSVRESDYLYYVLYVAFQCLFLASVNGLAFKYFWPEAIRWNDQVIVATLGVMLFSGNFTAIRFMKLTKSNGKGYTALLMLGLASLAVTVMSGILPFRAGVLVSAFLAVVSFMAGIPLALTRWYRGFAPARFFSLAWISLACGVFVLVFNKLGLMPRNFITENSTQIGSVLQVMLLSFALADRLNTEKKEKIEAQNQALEEERNARIANEKAIRNERLAREAKEEALLIQKEAAENLEQVVMEHTGQLNETLARMNEANHQIMSSLRYAKMIQLAILPDLETARSVIPGLAIWWVPRDVVGGDFYFIEPIRDGFIVAVGDCTGRGVAGAFMTIIAGSELKRIVKGENCHDPGDILARLNKRVKQALKQDSKRSLSEDGLDIGVCVVNRDSLTLSYSGANIDLVYAIDGEIHTLKGDRKSVGYISLGNIGYSVQSIGIERRMAVYIYTDGITDQLGERSGQRFGTRRLKDLISEYHRLPISVQCEIIKASSEVYRGGRDQVDDMTMVAFEV